MTDDEADLKVLPLANEHGKFALEFGGTLSEPEQLAFERGIDYEWFRFVDFTPLAVYPNKVFRVFRLTKAGRTRLEILKYGKALDTMD